jgi:hypothetical protein
MILLDKYHPLQKNRFYLFFLSGESYTRPNQSALRPYKHRESQIQKECKDMKDKVNKQLTKYCNRAPPKPMLDRYAQLLEHRLRLRYMAPLSFVDQMRAQREKQLTQSIRRKLRQEKLILRVCDKGGGLHISTKADYEQKAAEYRRNTGACEELTYNPLEEMINNVTSELKALKDTKQLSLYYYNLLVPKPEVVKQSYMYFNPKAHKVKMIKLNDQCIDERNHTCLGRNTTTSNYEYDKISDTIDF